MGIDGQGPCPPERRHLLRHRPARRETRAVPFSPFRPVTCVLVFLGIALVTARAQATPDHLEAWKAEYPRSTLPARLERTTGGLCTICHGLAGYEWDLPGNCYRETIHSLMHTGVGGFQSALDIADSMDSDADGVPNGVEIASERPDGEVGYHPGLAGVRGVDRCGAEGTEMVTNEPETPPIEPAIIAVPQVIGFDDLIPGAAAQRSFVIENLGASSRTITGVSIGKGLHLTCSVEAPGALPHVLAPGEDLRFLVDFHGSAGGYFYQMLGWPEVTTDDPVSPRLTVLVRSRGSIPTGIDAPDNLDFGIVAVLEAMDAAFTITNNGDRALTLAKAELGDGTGAFHITSQVAGSQVTPSGRTTVGLRYAPTVDGVHEDQLRIETDDPLVSELVVTLKGVGMWRLTPGDANQDGTIDVSDAVTVLLSLFLGGERGCPEAQDANDDGKLDISDAVHLLEVLFLRGSTFHGECRLETAGHYLGCPGGSPPCFPAEGGS